MAFELPPLPYPDDALEPDYSAKTISFHYGKHHKAYVDNLNKLVGGTDLEGKSLEELIMFSAGDAAKAPIFNNAAQVWNHTFFWNCMTPGGGGMPSRALTKRIGDAFGSFEKFAEQFKANAVGRFGSGWGWLVLDGDELKIVNTHQRRHADDQRPGGAAHRGRVGARLLPRLSEPPARLRAGVPRQAGELGLRRGEPGVSRLIHWATHDRRLISAGPNQNSNLAFRSFVL